MICTGCGLDNPDYAVVCEFCGTYLPREEAPGTKRDSILDPLGAKRIRCAYCWSQNEVSSDDDLSNAVCSVCGMRLAYVPYPEREGDYSDIPERIREEINVPDNENPIAAPPPMGMVRCRNCWKDNPESASTCEFCGYQLRRPNMGNYRKMKRLRQNTNYSGQYGRYSRDAWLVNSYLVTRSEKRAEEEAANATAAGRKVRCLRCFFDNPPGVTLCQGCGSLLSKARRHVSDEVKLKKEIRAKSGDFSLAGQENAGSSEISPTNAQNAGSPEIAPMYAQNAGNSNQVSREAGRIIPRFSKIGRRICTCGYQNLPGVTVCMMCGGRIMSEEEITQGGPKLCTCGYKNLPKVSICLMCKGLVTEKCSQCGFENPANATVCMNCSAQLGEPLAEDIEETDEEEKTKETEANAAATPEVPEVKEVSTSPLSSGLVRCRNCWKENSPYATTCAYCGYQLKRTKNSGYSTFRKLRDQTNFELPDASSSREEKTRPGLIAGTFSAIRESRRLDEQELLLRVSEEEERIERSKTSGFRNDLQAGKIRCRNCWYDNAPGAIACRECGAALSKTQTRRRSRILLEDIVKNGAEGKNDADGGTDGESGEDNE